MRYRVLFFVVILAGTVFAGAIKKGGYDLYWKNKIALAPVEAIVVDSLVSEFLKAPDFFGVIDSTGKIPSGGKRRSFSADHQIGWIMTMVHTYTVTDNGEPYHLCQIHTELVFDLREIEKK